MANNYTNQNLFMMNAVKRLIILCIKEIRSAGLPFSLSNTMSVSGQKAYGLVSYEKPILPVSAACCRKYPVLFISVACCLFIISVTKAQVQQAIANKIITTEQKNIQLPAGDSFENTNLLFKGYLSAIIPGMLNFSFYTTKIRKTFIK